MGTKRTMLEQNPLFYSIDPMDSIYLDRACMPAPYTSNVGHMKLPFGKFSDPDIFLDAYMRNGNPSMKTLCLAGIKPELAANEEAMFKIIRLVPEAVRQAEAFNHASTPEEQLDFIKKAMMVNPEVYGFLPKAMQKDEAVIDAYAKAMWTNGSRYYCHEPEGWQDHDMGEPTESLPTYKYDINPNCDLNRFYSVQNYEAAHEALILGGIYQDAYRGDPRMHGEFPRFNQAVAYLQMANLNAADNPQMMNQYRLVEARNIEKHIDRLTEEIRRNPHTDRAKMIAEAVVRSVQVLAQDTTRQGQDPNRLIEAVINAEKEYYKELGQKLRNELSQYNNGLANRAEFIDFMMDKAASHPEMGISKEEQETWWQQRGQDYQYAKENPLQYPAQQAARLGHFEQYAKDHAELRVGEQLKIEGFDSFDMSDIQRR